MWRGGGGGEGDGLHPTFPPVAFLLWTTSHYYWLFLSHSTFSSLVGSTTCLVYNSIGSFCYSHMIPITCSCITTLPLHYLFCIPSTWQHMPFIVFPFSPHICPACLPHIDIPCVVVHHRTTGFYLYSAFLPTYQLLPAYTTFWFLLPTTILPPCLLLLPTHTICSFNSLLPTYHLSAYAPSSHFTTASTTTYHRWFPLDSPVLQFSLPPHHPFTPPTTPLDLSFPPPCRYTVSSPSLYTHFLPGMVVVFTYLCFCPLCLPTIHFYYMPATYTHTALCPLPSHTTLEENFFISLSSSLPLHTLLACILGAIIYLYTHAFLHLFLFICTVCIFVTTFGCTFCPTPLAFPSLPLHILQAVCLLPVSCFPYILPSPTFGRCVALPHTHCLNRFSPLHTTIFVAFDIGWAKDQGSLVRICRRRRKEGPALPHCACLPCL